jgi:predicted transcriptional regulator
MEAFLQLSYVAATYAATWSAMAKAIGLGQLGGNAGARKCAATI